MYGWLLLPMFSLDWNLKEKKTSLLVIIYYCLIFNIWAAGNALTKCLFFPQVLILLFTPSPCSPSLRTAWYLVPVTVEGQRGQRGNFRALGLTVRSQTFTWSNTLILPLPFLPVLDRITKWLPEENEHSLRAGKASMLRTLFLSFLMN